ELNAGVASLATASLRLSGSEIRDAAKQWNATMWTAQLNMLAQGGPYLVQGMTIFFIAGFLMVFGALVAGQPARPGRPDPDKMTAYECGGPAICSSWVQFDLRFYVVALVFLVFDVEVALFYPWAVVYGGGSRPKDTPPEVLHQIKLA